MAEDWSVCIKVYGTEPGLAPHRYFDTFDVYKSLAEYALMFLFFFNKLYNSRRGVFVYPGSTLLTGSSSLQLWSNVDGVKDEDGEEGKPTEMTIRDSHSAWSCIWQSK